MFLENKYPLRQQIYRIYCKPLKSEREQKPIKDKSLYIPEELRVLYIFCADCASETKY